MLLRRLAIVVPVALLVAASALAETPNPDIKGLWLTTPYPVVTLKGGEETKLPVSLVNYNEPPLRADLSLKTAPAGWTVELRGSNRKVGAAFIDVNDKVSFDLDVKIPADAKPGKYEIALAATGGGNNLNLPITVEVVAPEAAQLKLEPKLPVLRGTAKSNFEFQVKVTNDSADDATLNLASAAPNGFETVFKEGYGSQELTSLPIKAGESKDIAATVKPPQNVPAGRYPVRLAFATAKTSAETDVALDITGQPQVSITGPDGRLSGEAYAGKERSFDLIVRNNGSADARDLKLSGSGSSGWKFTMAPEEIAVLPPDGEQKVTALVTPSDKAIAGDYMASFTVSGDDSSDTARYRITVLTSTMWGIAGLGVIAAALLVMFGAVRRFGRR
jgi:Predicted membrane protein